MSYLARAKEAARQWRQANGIPLDADLSALLSVVSQDQKTEIGPPEAEAEKTRSRARGERERNEISEERENESERRESLSSSSPASLLEAAWSPRPDLSRYIPDHAALLFAFLQDHCGAFFTPDDLYRRRGGPREDLEACLTLLLATDLVATLPEPGPLRYGAREPRYLGQCRPRREPSAGPDIFASGSPA